ncbi:MAG: 16S rRNA (cytosine(1402)-N(4))-methyltransferase RsmH [Alphaproteobacteria bacterium]|nr:16S rRNA (cytosine(1402)-N(4))-methyltransferase RsmH [Alphaproteobacteria bacterium]
MIAPSEPASRHLPVMLPEVLAALAPRDGGTYVDGTFGAGGYTRGILAAAKSHVVAIDRDPNAIRGGAGLVAEMAGRLSLVRGTFGEMQAILADLGLSKVQGVVLDIGVSSMQIDEAARGFSFMREGPLDMRMGQEGKSAADYVNTLAAEALAQIIFVYGEEPRSRSIAKAIVEARAEGPLKTTLDLVKAVERATGPQRFNDRIHPATKTFQALRIHVNSELDELAQALTAAEEILDEKGRLVVVTFHSLEDRIVKRFFAARAGKLPTGSRHAPELHIGPAPSFELIHKGHLEASELEKRDNPRARSAKLRAGIRSSAAAFTFDAKSMAVPHLSKGKH